MPRNKRKEEVESNGMNKYLWKQDTGDETPLQNSDNEELYMSDLKGEFIKVNSELKEIRQKFRDLDFRLPSIEGKLTGIETSVGQLQGEVSVVKLRVALTEKKLEDTDITIKELGADVGEMSDIE